MAVVCPICKSSAQEVPHTGDATDQRRRLQSCGWDYEPRLYDGGRGSPGTLGHPFGGPLFVSSSGFIRCNSIRDTVQAQHKNIPRQHNGHHRSDSEP